jgi:hypothetical protein
VPEPALLRRRRITYSCRLRSLRELRCITARFRAPRRQLENVRRHASTTGGPGSRYKWSRLGLCTLGDRSSLDLGWNSHSGPK